jgi:pimeloyl-ACP methyl ester carboxylesterase
VSFVEELLIALNIQSKITLVVHDIGGIMGIPWAAKHLDRLNALIYTNTVAFSNFKWFDTASRWGNNSPAGHKIAHFSMKAIGWFHGWLFKKIFSKQNPQLTNQQINRIVEDFALNTIAKQTTLCEFRQITKSDFFNGYDQMLKAISESVPTLTMWGKGDPYVADRFANELLAKKTMILPEIGHWVPIVAFESMAHEIQSFLK